MKAAVTDWALVIKTLHMAVPLQAPLHPLNVQPLAAVAFKSTVEPDAKFRKQVPLAQVRPAGVLVTVPLPVTVADRAY